jgi:DNA-binding NarL/FixJ family response regulator
MPDLPVLVLTPHDDEEFLGLARQAGATPFAGQSPDVSSVARTLCSALTAGDLATEVRERIATSHSLSHDISDLTKRARELTAEARSTLGKPRRSTRFLPLVVEDDADQAFLMVRAFEKADVFAPLPILRSAEEAIAYLDGKDPFEDRAKYPLPSVVLIDVKLAGTPGLELLGWIRKQPRFRRMAVIMLSDSSDMNYVNRAYQSGANSYLIKPSRFEALVELFHGLEFYWGNFNLGPDL